MEFSPRLAPDDFRAAFTAAQGWGTFEQKSADSVSTAELSVKWGTVPLKTLRLSPKLRNTDEVTVTYAGKKLSANVMANESSTEITLSQPVTVAAGEQLKVVLQ